MILVQEHNISLRQHGRYSLLELSEAFNHDGISWDDNRLDGDEWVAGTAYPAEELPLSNQVTSLGGIPFVFPDKADSKNNNIACDSQRLCLATPVQTDMLAFLCSGDAGNYSETFSIFSHEHSPLKIRVGFSDWLNITPTLNSFDAIRTSHVHRGNADYFTPRSLWLQKICFSDVIHLKAIDLSDNPFAHIFGITVRQV